MRKSHALLALSGALLLLPLMNRVTVVSASAAVSEGDNVTNIDRLNENIKLKKMELLTGSLSSWYVNTYSSVKRYAFGIRIPDAINDYENGYYDQREDRFGALNYWNNFSFLLNDGSEVAVTPFETTRNRIILNSYRFQFDFSLPATFDLSTIKALKIKKGTQIPTQAYIKNVATSKYTVDDVFELARDYVVAMSLNPSYSESPAAEPFKYSAYQGYVRNDVDLSLLTSAFNLLKNGSQTNRYRLYIRTPEEGVDFGLVDKSVYADGVVENTYVGGLSWAKEHIYFDNTPVIPQTSHEGWTTFGLYNELDEITFDINCSLGSATSLTILKGTELPSLAYATDNANDIVTNVKNVYSVKEDIAIALTANPDYSGNSGSAPFILGEVKKLDTVKDEAKAVLDAYKIEDYLLEDQAKATKAVNDGKAAIDDAKTAKDVEEELAYAEGVLFTCRTKEYYKDLTDSTNAIAKIDAIGVVTLESGQKIDEARAAYDACSIKAKIMVGEEKYNILVKAEADYKEMVDTAAAQSVIDKINAIGEVKISSAQKIDEARAAYDALNSNAKSKVPDEILQKLIAAEKEISIIKDDRASANVVEQLINNIGTVTLASELDITQARAAYESLNDHAKSLVEPETLQILIDAEAKLVELKADQKAQDDANATIDLINAIGTVTAESEDAINKARTSYDALSAAAKAKVGDAYLKMLTDAEAKLVEAKNPKSPVNTIIWIVIGSAVAVAAVAVGFVVILKKKKKQ